MGPVSVPLSSMTSEPDPLPNRRGSSFNGSGFRRVTWLRRPVWDATDPSHGSFYDTSAGPHGLLRAGAGLATHDKDEIPAWDVVNEPHIGDGCLRQERQEVVHKVMGIRYITNVRRTARGRPERRGCVATTRAPGAERQGRRSPCAGHVHARPGVPVPGRGTGATSRSLAPPRPCWRRCHCGPSQRGGTSP